MADPTRPEAATHPAPEAGRAAEADASRGALALVGSGEFLPVMRDVDDHLLLGRPRRVAVIPTAAGPEGDTSVGRWFRLAEDHYAAMGCEVVRVDVRDRSQADDPGVAGLLDGCGLVYLSGGNPSHLAGALHGTVLGRRILTASREGAAVAGCSAGAMAMGRVALGVRSPATDGLGIVGPVATIPHFDRFGFARRIAGAVLGRTAEDDMVVVGVDEDTAVVWSPQARTWTVMGSARAWLLDATGGRGEGYGAGEHIPLPPPPAV